MGDDGGRKFWISSLLNFSNCRMKAIQNLFRKWFPCSSKILAGSWGSWLNLCKRTSPSMHAFFLLLTRERMCRPSRSGKKVISCFFLTCRCMSSEHSLCLTSSGYQLSWWQALIPPSPWCSVHLQGWGEWVTFLSRVSFCGWLFLSSGFLWVMQ